MPNKTTPCQHKEYPDIGSDEIISVHEINLQPPTGYRWKGKKKKETTIYILNTCICHS